MSKKDVFLNLLNLVGAPLLLAAGVPAPLIPVVQHGMVVVEQAVHPDTQEPLTGVQKTALVVDGANTAIAGINAVKPGAVDPAVVPTVQQAVIDTVRAINVIAKRS